MIMFAHHIYIHFNVDLGHTNFCFNLNFVAVQFMCRTGNKKHPLRIIFGVLFAAALYGELAAHYI